MKIRCVFFFDAPFGILLMFDGVVDARGSSNKRWWMEFVA